MKPLVSIIIPSRNNSQYLSACIDSCLSQTYTHIEVLVVDDFSTDDSLDVAYSFADSDPRIKILNLPLEDSNRTFRGVDINAGYLARNYGISHARGEWITFVDSDDLISDFRINHLVTAAKTCDALHITTTYNKFSLESPLELPPDYSWELIFDTKILFSHLLQQNDFFSFKPNWFRKYFPLHLRLSRRLRPFFFPSPMSPYPGVGGGPFIHSSVATRFRPLRLREWSSSSGRGSDRDFNFRVLFDYGQSIFIDSKSYHWRT